MLQRLELIYSVFVNSVTTFVVRTFGNINVCRKVVFKKVPHILKHKDAKIKIGINTVINSSNFGYHINMHSRCKLYADRANALIEIGSNCRIHGTCIHAYQSIKIGDNCLIAANTQIIDGNGHALSFHNPADRINTTDNGKEIIIEDNVWIAANCIILGGSHIGSGSIITTGSVVKGAVPKNCIFGGNPARLIKQY